MARKPLIQPGSVLPPAGDAPSEGVLDRIIARDREKNGRGEARQTEEEPKNVTTLQRSTETTQDTTNEETGAGSLLPAPAPTNVPQSIQKGQSAGVDSVDQSAESAPKGDDTEGRMQTALARAKDDDIAVVTVRAPSSLNSYIDRYVERINRVHPKLKYRKQDAVAEMFAWFYAEHPLPPAPAEDDL